MNEEPDSSYASRDPDADWGNTPLEVRCPRCGYDLRLLTEPRCPECGSGFRWEVLLEVARAEAECAGSFEYLWRRQPLRSLVRTILKMLLPWRFWSRYRRTVPLQPGPLILLAVLTLLLVLAASAATEFVWHEFIKIYSRTRYGQQDFSGFPFNWHAEAALSHFATPLVVLGAVWLVILVFPQTRRRYAISQSQIVRVVLMTWVATVVSDALAQFALTLATMPVWWRGLVLHPIAQHAADAVPGLILIASLMSAFSLYVKVRGGWLWALIVLVLSATALTGLGILLSVRYYDSFHTAYWDLLAEWCPGARWVGGLAQDSLVRLQAVR